MTIGKASAGPSQLETRIQQEIAALNDETIHKAKRLAIIDILLSLPTLPFTQLMMKTGLTHGNLSAHLLVLERAGLIEMHKGYEARKPRTMVLLTSDGACAVDNYWRRMRRIANLRRTLESGSLEGQ